MGNNLFNALTQNKPQILNQNPLGMQMGNLGNLDIANMAQQFYSNQQNQKAVGNNMN